LTERVKKNKRRAAAMQRRENASKTAAGTLLLNADNFRIFCGDGYVPLYDVPEVRACVDTIADLVSSMTIHLLRKTPTGDERVIDGLSRKIDIEPAENMNRKAFIYNIVNTMLSEGDGNQITLPIYTDDGYLADLKPLRPSETIIQDDNDSYIIRWRGKILHPDEVLHFANRPDPERPWRGTGMRVSLSGIVDCIRQANTTKKELLETPMPSIIVKVDGLSDAFVGPEGREKLTKEYIDTQRSGRPWMIPAEVMSVESIRPLSIADLAIKDTLELDKRRTAALFGVPAFLIGVGDFNRDEYDNFITTKIMAYAQILQQEMTRKLLESKDMFFRFSPRSLYAYKLPELINAGAAMVERQAMRRNEWRDWVGLPPDAEMNEIIALENYIPASKLGDQKKLIQKEGDDA